MIPNGGTPDPASRQAQLLKISRMTGPAQCASQQNPSLVSPESKTFATRKDRKPGGSSAICSHIPYMWKQLVHYQGLCNIISCPVQSEINDPKELSTSHFVNVSSDFRINQIFKNGFDKIRK